jgi:rubrerythrin
MHAMTAANLRSAYGGESMARVRYHTWGRKAAQDGFPNVGRLFQAIPYAEEVHATNCLHRLAHETGGFLVASMAPFGYGATSNNLVGAIGGETFEVSGIYPAYLEEARHREEPGAQLSFHRALAAERIHARLFQLAKEAVDSGKDMDVKPVQVCDVCGWTSAGAAVDECPICKAKRDRLAVFA